MSGTHAICMVCDGAYCPLCTQRTVRYHGNRPSCFPKLYRPSQRDRPA